MSHPSNDPTAEQAQKEIWRRLLRQERLKRIEDEQRRSLAAMGWQPSRGGPAARRGPSVHEAADAIEVTEQKKRAFAQEAQRRADARQNDAIALRDKSEVQRRAEDRKALALYLDRVQAMLAQVENNARDGGAIAEGPKWYAPSGSTDVSSIDLQGFAGRAKLRGDGDFTFKRRGNEIEFSGIVQQGFDEPYDFESNTEFPTLNPWNPFGRFDGEDARQLALHGRAKDFRMESQWPQRVEGTLRIKPNGRIEFADDPRWSDIDPYEFQPWP